MKMEKEFGQAIFGSSTGKFKTQFKPRKFSYSLQNMTIPIIACPDCTRLRNLQSLSAQKTNKNLTREDRLAGARKANATKRAKKEARQAKQSVDNSNEIAE